MEIVFLNTTKTTAVTGCTSPLQHISQALVSKLFITGTLDWQICCTEWINFSEIFLSKYLRVNDEPFGQQRSIQEQQDHDHYAK